MGPPSRDIPNDPNSGRHVGTPSTTLDTSRETTEPPGLAGSEDDDGTAGLQSEGPLEAVEGFIPFRRALLT